MGSGHKLNLVRLRNELSVCRLSADSPVPAWASGGDFVSVTRTREELSIVCSAANVPRSVRVEPGWVGLRLLGVQDFSWTGILASLAGPLAEAGIPVFVISTFDTDYLLVREVQLDLAAEVLRRAGHSVNTQDNDEDGSRSRGNRSH